MAHIFISYAREDIDIAGKIVQALAENNLDTWVDWKSLTKAEDWEQEIYRGIEEADSFLFLISIDSVTSEVCNKEILHATQNGKRIIPIFIGGVKEKKVYKEAYDVINNFLDGKAKDEISKRNFIFCRKELNEFDEAIQHIQTAIHTDYAWVEAQRRIQVKALEWERNHKENSFLLRGKDLSDAELQFTGNSSKDPSPTNLQRKYIYESRNNENTQKQLSRRRRNIISIIGVILLILVVLGATEQLNRFIYKPVNMEDYWAIIPAGEFQMGSENGDIDQMPIHTVYLDEFQIGKYEITNKQYNQCIRAKVCDGSLEPEKPDHPKTFITWFDAKDYCEWVGGRLPTEAEWEKAARGGLQGKEYPWGNVNPICMKGIPNGANFGDNSCNKQGALPVGSFSPNGYGLYDMSGNVWEWTNDWYDENYYTNSPILKPLGPSSGRSRVLRGGSWYGNINGVPLSTRFSVNPVFIFDVGNGFRCAR